MTAPELTEDIYDITRARGATGLLAQFNAIGVLAPADVHVATRLTKLAGASEDEQVVLATALAVRAPRLGHVFVDLETISGTAAVESEDPVDLSVLPWPEPGAWTAAVAASELVAEGEEGGADRPFRLVDGSRLYLDRYWRDERQVAADLSALAATTPGPIDDEVLSEGLTRLWAERPDPSQQLAAAAAVLRGFVVIAGGPGTGKTTTVARIVALLAEQAEAADGSPPHVALATPTAKAAARLAEAVREETARLPVTDSTRAVLDEAGARTLHRLLGWRPGSHSRFRHHRGNRLPHDVVIVDETSMVSLSMMARLVESVRADARLVLIGDPGQLTSIEAGAALGDIVGPVTRGLRITAETRDRLARVTGHPVEATDPPSGVLIGDGTVVLDRSHRFGTGIADLATAVRDGDAGAALRVLEDAPDGVTWIPMDVADEGSETALEVVRHAAVAAAKKVIGAADRGDGQSALAALADFRILCAHRQGAHGVATWTGRIESWLAAAIPGFGSGGRWYVGRPLLVTENDYGLSLFNGDTGVVIAGTDERATAVFESRSGELSPSRLGAVDTVYAMTIHKSQGSQFGTVAVLLPPASSRLLSQELLYTAITRAQEELVLVGTEDTIRNAIKRPVARASGLRRRLWGD